jgi:nitrate/TMAO reductase-like tetraheme cytochrome c subunit
MELKEKLGVGKTLLKFEIPEITSNSGNQILESIGKEKLQSLDKSIKDIKTLISERETLSKKFIQEGEEVKTEMNNFLLENENVKGMEKTDLIKEKNSIRNKKIEISELQLKEKIDCWKDVALLKKELRENEKQFSEKQSRMDELNKLLEED